MLDAETHIIDRLRAAMMRPAAGGVVNQPCVRHVMGVPDLKIDNLRQYAPAVFVMMDATTTRGDAHSLVWVQRFATIVTIESSVSQAQSPVAAMQAAAPILRALVATLHGWTPQVAANIGNGSPTATTYTPLVLKGTLKPNFHNGYWAIPVLWETSEPVCAADAATRNLPLAVPAVHTSCAQNPLL